MVEQQLKGFLLPAIVMIITAAVIIGIGSQVITDFRTTVGTQQSVTTYNESFTASNATNVKLARVDKSFIAITGTPIFTNQTPIGGAINNANFTVNTNTGEVMLSTGGGAYVWEGLGVNITYTLSEYAENTAWNASSEGITAQEKLANWLPTMAVIIVAAIIIMIVYAYFFRV